MLIFHGLIASSRQHPSDRAIFYEVTLMRSNTTRAEEIRARVNSRTACAAEKPKKPSKPARTAKIKINSNSERTYLTPSGKAKEYIRSGMFFSRLQPALLRKNQCASFRNLSQASTLILPYLSICTQHVAIVAAPENAGQSSSRTFYIARSRERVAKDERRSEPRAVNAADQKERAEHIMLGSGRNISRVCETVALRVKSS